MPFPDQIESATFSLEQVKVLSSPFTHEVFSVMSWDNPMSAREVGEAIGKSGATVTYHIDKLVKSGLLVLASTRKRRAQTEHLYVRNSRSFRVDRDNKDPEYLEQSTQAFEAFFRSVVRDRRAMNKYYLSGGERTDIATFRRGGVWVDQSTAEKISTKIAELNDLINNSSASANEARNDPDYVRVNFVNVFCATKTEFERLTTTPSKKTK